MGAQRADNASCRRCRRSERVSHTMLTVASMAVLCWASTASGLTMEQVAGAQSRGLLSHGGTMASLRCMENEYARGPLQQDLAMPSEELMCERCPANFRSNGVAMTTCKLCPWNRFTDHTDWNGAGSGPRVARIADQCSQVCDPKTTIGANSDRTGCLCAPGHEPFPKPSDYPDIRPILDRCRPCGEDFYHLGGLDTSLVNKAPGTVGTCAACDAGGAVGQSTGGLVGQSACGACATGYVPNAKAVSGCVKATACDTANGRTSRPNGSSDCATDYVCDVDFFTTWDYDAATKTTTKNCNACEGPSKGTNGAVDQTKCVCNKNYFKVAAHTEDCWKCDTATTVNQTAGGANTACECKEGYTSFVVDYTGKTGKCTMCLPGWAMIGGVCKRCGRGTYTSAVNKDAACTACEPGTIAPFIGATACKRCMVTSTGGVVDSNPARTQCGCKPGYYYWANPADTRDDAEPGCTPCPADTFNAANLFGALSDCTACPIGKSTGGAVGQTSCNVCAVGWFKDKADATGATCTSCGGGGKTAPDGKTPVDLAGCTQCRRGYFKVVTGATFTCNVCDEESTRGVLATGPGNTTGHDLTTCTCRKGYDPASFNAGSGKCTLCELGYEQSSLGGACTLCKPGFTRAAAPVAPALATCQACTSGYANAARTACSPCDPDTTTGPNPKFERCECAPGYNLFDPVTGRCVRHENELASIESYYAGLRNGDPAYVNLAAPYGRKGSKQAIGSDGCQVGSYLGKDDYCYACDTVSTVSGNAGTALYKNRGANATTCECAVGYKNFDPNTGACVNCVDGWEHTADKRACVKCGFTTAAPYSTQTFVSGQYFDGKNLLIGQCTPCPAGTQRPTPALGTWDPYAPCAPCPRGKSSVPGGACTDCGMLANHAVTLTDACKPCPVNEWAVPGALSCQPCPPNTERRADMNGCQPCPLAMERAAGQPACTLQPNMVAGTERGLLLLSKRLSSKFVDGVALAAAADKAKAVEVRTTLLVSYPTTSNPVELRDAQIMTGLTTSSDGWVVGKPLGAIALPRIDFAGTANCSDPAWRSTVAAWLEKAAGSGKATVGCHPRNNATLTSPELVRMLPQNTRAANPGRRSLHQFSSGCDQPSASVYAYITFASEDPASAAAVSAVQALAGTSEAFLGSVCSPMPVWPAAVLPVTAPLRLTAAGMRANASDACFSVKPAFDGALRALVPGTAVFASECGTQDGQVLTAPVPAAPPPPPPSEDKELTTAEMAGVIVGSVCGGLLLIALLAFLAVRSRRRSSQAVTDNSYGTAGDYGNGGPGGYGESGPNNIEAPLNPVPNPVPNPSPPVHGDQGGYRAVASSGGPSPQPPSPGPGSSPPGVPPSGSIVRVQVARGSTTSVTPVRGPGQ